MVGVFFIPNLKSDLCRDIRRCGLVRRRQKPQRGVGDALRKQTLPPGPLAPAAPYLESMKKKDESAALVDALYELVSALSRQVDDQEERLKAVEEGFVLVRHYAEGTVQ